MCVLICRAPWFPQGRVPWAGICNSILLTDTSGKCIDWQMHGTFIHRESRCTDGNPVQLGGFMEKHLHMAGGQVTNPNCSYPHAMLYAVRAESQQ